MNPVTVSHRLLGPVVITPRAASRNIKARWKQGVVHLSVPLGASARVVSEALDSLAPRILAVRPRLDILAPGTVLSLDSVEVRILPPSASFNSGIRYSFSSSENVPYILTLIPGSSVDPAAGTYPAMMSKVVANALTPVAESLLIPLGRLHAERVGRFPVSWRIGRGMRILGTCSSSRVITLSRGLLFLPSRLRDYVVCHELAHLSEMNHGPRFHQVLESYLPGATALSRELHHYRWPVLR